MELRHLRYFVAVAEEKNFSRAAERVRVAQPALSKQVRTLEHQLGAVLFERRPRTVELTAAGRHLLPRARRLLAMAAGLQDEVRAAAGKLPEVVRIAFNAAAPDKILDEALAQLRIARSRLRLELVDLPSGLQAKALRDGSVHLCLGLDIPPGRKVRRLLLRRDRLMLIVREGHPLAELPAIPASALRDEPVVILRPELSRTLHREFRRYCAAQRVRPNIVDDFATMAAGLRFVTSGRGMAPAPEALCPTLHVGSIFKPLVPPGPSLDWHLLWRADRITPALSLLLDIVRRELSLPFRSERVTS